MRTDLEIREYRDRCIVWGPEVWDDGSRVPLALIQRRQGAEALLERLQQLESCSLLELDHYARPATVMKTEMTRGTTIKMPVQFANMVKV